MAKLHEVKPREQVGRDTLDRYDAQLRAASIACLSILSGKETQRIYCEFHDDFVIEKLINNITQYTFVQVKTKGKLRDTWKINDVFGILKTETKKKIQSFENIRDSFVGKLLQHTVNFHDSCEKVVFMTNTHLDDDIEEIILDIEQGTFNNRNTKTLLKYFNECFFNKEMESKFPNKFSDDDIKEKVKKLIFESDVEYIKNKDENFEALAREKIYQYSEIDLEYTESKEILLSLLGLIYKKSKRKIDKCTQDNIFECSGIGIDDLLSVLSISKNAYYQLLESGDDKAIKSASVIERMLRKAGADDQEIEFCSKCKIRWDTWIRNNRHIISDLDFTIINGYVDDEIQQLSRTNNVIRVESLLERVNNIINKLKAQNLQLDLNKETIIGGIFSKLVGYEK